MLISDISYLETAVEDTNIEGAGYADFVELLNLQVNGQRLALANVLQSITVKADVWKTIDFTKSVTARAEV